jgi:hypothetical protein
MDGTQTQEVDRLETLVQIRLSGRVHNFQLLWRDNGLVLRGQARTYYAKQLAQHAVMEVSEAPILANEIEVT